VARTAPVKLVGRSGDRLVDLWLADFVAAVLVLAVAAVGLAWLRGNETLTAYDFGTDPGPALFPRLLLQALGLGGLVLLARALWGLAAIRRRGGVRTDRAAGAGWRRAAWGALWPAVFLLSLAAYLAALPRLGFVPATTAFALAWILVLTRRQDRRLGLRAVAAAIVAALAISLLTAAVFEGFVQVPLP